MWYEILPTLGIFSTFLILPQFIPWGVYMVLRGQPYRRTCLDPEDRKFTMRDERITGHVYKINGFEAIPDLK